MEAQGKIKFVRLVEQYTTINLTTYTTAAYDVYRLATPGNSPFDFKQPILLKRISTFCHTCIFSVAPIRGQVWDFMVNLSFNFQGAAIPMDYNLNNATPLCYFWSGAGAGNMEMVFEDDFIIDEIISDPNPMLRVNPGGNGANFTSVDLDIYLWYQNLKSENLG